MKVYRLYVNGECVQTFGDGQACLTTAYLAMGEWFNCGYTSEQCEVRYENY